MSPTDADADPAATKPSLLLRIRDAADAASWAEFAGVYGPLIRTYARRRGLQDADARDVEQEVLAQVARSIAAFEYDPSRGRFRDWLGTVTRRKVSRFRDAAARAVRAFGGDGGGDRFDAIDDPGTDPEWTTDFHARVLEAALDRIRGGFEPQTWDAFARVWAEGRPASEVASALNLSIDSVYAAKSRALKRLREEIRALAEDLPLASPGPP